MGLEARQTQASRDGGVDCVAYDTRPIIDGSSLLYLLETHAGVTARIEPPEE
jgi:hypothetical protein